MTDAERQEHADRLSKASNKADEAIAAEDAGGASAAQELWYALFGDPFPEPGKNDRKAKIADPSGPGPPASAGGRSSSAAVVARSCRVGRSVWNRTRLHRAARTRGPRRPATLADRVAALRQLEDGLRGAYAVERLHVDHRMQAFAWRVRVKVPVYDETVDLQIELGEGHPVRVVAENWTGPMKHTFGRPIRSLHRPLSSYVNALASFGFAVHAMLAIPDLPPEAWPSVGRRSLPANSDIPLFLGLRAVRG